MRYNGLLIIIVLGLGCGAAHPITEAPYINLSVGVDGVRLQSFPTAIIDSLGWNDLASADLRKFGEEIQIAVLSDQKPYQLYRFSNSKKDPGEAILFWPLPDVEIGLEPQENMHDFLEGVCTEILVAGDYEYCIPLFSQDVNWKENFSDLVERNIWSLPGSYEFENTDEEVISNWSLVFQMRAGVNYRTFTHNNPDTYVTTAQALNIMAMVNQLRNIAVNLTPSQNYYTYQGITTGTSGSEFFPCGSEEIWRFNGDIDELTSQNGLPMTMTESDSIKFLVKVEGTIRDEWYAQRNITGVTKVITPVQINSFSVTSANKCDNY